MADQEDLPPLSETETLLSPMRKMRSKHQAEVRPTIFGAIKGRGMQICMKKQTAVSEVSAKSVKEDIELSRKLSTELEKQASSSRQQPRRGLGAWSAGNGFQATASCPLGSKTSEKTAMEKMRSEAKTRLAARTEEMQPSGSDVGRKKFGFGREELDEEPGAYYEGQFKLYQRHGKGILYFPIRGETYEGQFASDTFDGSGKKSWSDNSEYVGQWSKGVKSGKGKYVDKDQMVYEGQWEDGRRNGFGSQTFPNGDSYKGGWFRGMQSGRGTYSFKDGREYEGTWSTGRYDGSGILRRPDGVNEKHVYKFGVLQERYVMVKKEEKDRSGAIRKDRFGNKQGHEVKQTRDNMTKDTLYPAMPLSEHLTEKPGYIEMLRECGGRQALDNMTEAQATALMDGWQSEAMALAEDQLNPNGLLPGQIVRVGSPGSPMKLGRETTTPSTAWGPSPSPSSPDRLGSATPAEAGGRGETPLPPAGHLRPNSSAW